VDVLFSSPPYGLGDSISLSGNKNMKGGSSAYETHDDDPDKWMDLMNGWDDAWNGFCRSMYVNVQPLAGNRSNLIQWIAFRSNHLCNIITWDKGHSAPQMAKGVLATRYEWVVVMNNLTHNGSSAMPFATWQGKYQSVYEGPPQRKNEFSEIHGATMPCHLPEFIIGEIADSSRTVCDPFGGTGTTMIACEKLGKICYMMELDPKYCDVIIKRWEDFTGKKAELIA